MRPPDQVIGGAERPYMLRWCLLPKNRWVNVYLHKVVRADDERALHDHPWWNVSILLRGSYVEVMPDLSKAPTPYTRIADLPVIRKIRRPGSIIFRRATDAHRLELPIDGGGIRYVWTLFVTGPYRRDWGFHCADGWRDRGEFYDRGCE